MTSIQIQILIRNTIGPITNVSTTSNAIEFRTSDALKLNDIIKLSEVLKTDQINFNFGHSGERGYSEYTPGIEGAPGWVEIKWNITIKKLKL